jgi:hypothetical protein
MNDSMPRAFRAQLLLAAALAATALVATAAGLSFLRKVGSFQPLGIEIRPAAGHWVVTDASPGIPLREGDQILLVNGSATAAAPLRELLTEAPESTLVVLRDGQLARIEYRRPPLDVDAPYLILALVGAGYLLVGLYTLLKDRRRPAIIFFLWSLVSAALYLLSPLPPFDGPGKAIYLLDEVARLLLPPLTLHLFLIFPWPLAEGSRWRRGIPFLYLPAAFFLALQADLMLADGAWFFGGATASAMRLLDRLELLHLVVFATAALGVLGWRLRSTPAWEEHRQVAWVAVGLAGGYAPFLLLYGVPAVLGLRSPELLTSLAVVPLAFVPLTFAYAILRYKLWDIGVIVRDTISLTLTLLLGVFGFSLANLAINQSLPDELSLARNLLSFLAGLMIAGVLIPTRRVLSASLERLQYAGSFGKRRALADYGRELLAERSLDRLCAALLRQLEEGLELAQANLFLSQDGRLVPVRPEPGVGDLPLDALGMAFWNAEVVSISGVALPEAGFSLPELDLFRLGYRYAFPLKVHDARVGLVVTAYRQDDTPLNSDDVDLVRSLLNQTALAIENARLLDQLHRQLEEVVRLQQHNQGIIESSPAGIAVLDRGDRVVSANLSFAGLMGRGQEQLTGEKLEDLLPVHPLPRPDEGLVDVSFCDRAGRERHFQLSTARLRDEGSEGLRVLVVQDTSERVAMENALKEKDRLASLGMLAAGVAHEVNTPITGISSYAQLLLAETPPNDPRYELLQKVERQTFRAARIVNNLLEFARNRERERRTLPLGPLIQECLELLRERIASRRIRIAWEEPGEVLAVYGNDGELHQVFTNLILNAADAMTAGGTLGIGLDGDEDSVRATVTDTGPGIPPEDLERIFQPFYSTKLARGGTGLGLSISYNIVSRHGGEIRVESRPGEGSRFTVELPRYRTEAATDR